MCEKAVKKLLFAIIHVPDQHKTPQMCKNVNSKKKKKKILGCCNLILIATKSKK